MKINYGRGEFFTYAFSPIIQSFGGDLINRSDYGSASGVLDGLEAVEAMTHFQSWFQEGWANPTPLTDDDFYGSKKAALSWVGHWMYDVHTQALGDDLILLPMPDFGNGPKTGMGSWNWGITSSCQDSEAAWAFLEYLVSIETIKRLTDINGAVPARQSALAQSELYGPDGPLHLFVQQLESDVAVPRPKTPAYAAITKAVAGAIDNIINGADVQAELTKAAQEIDQDIEAHQGYPGELAEAITTPQPTAEVATATATPTPEPTETTQPTNTPEPSATPEPTETPTPTNTPTSTATTAAPTQTPTPTPTPTPRAVLSGQIVYPAYSLNINSYNIWRANVDGSSSTLIVGNASQPKYNQDGTLLAYRSWDPNERGIHLVNLTNGFQRRLTTFTEDALPGWSSGGTLFFTSRREADRAPRLFWVDQEGGDGYSLGFSGDYVDILPDDHLAVHGCTSGGDCGLWILMADGSPVHKISTYTNDTAPAVHPQGRSIAIMSLDRDNAQNWEIWTINEDGSNPVRLTDNPANDGLPAWSPDGRSIAFVSDREGVWAIWAMDADGSNQRKLFNMQGPPDGQVLHDIPNSKGWLEERIDWIP
jgi:hypothetical protein